MGGDKHDVSYYLKCIVGGALGCGLTHAFVTPLDLVKCRRQVDPQLYKSFFSGINAIKASHGVSGLFLGWQPTLIGYSLQGMGKFGFYEIFKDVFAGLVGYENAVKFQSIGYGISSASAEVLADLFLCPFEAVKVRVQTSLPGTFPTQFGEAFNKIRADEGIAGFYKGIAPLWARQVPYTIVKFVFFEKTVQAFYKYIFTQPKDTYNKATQLSITFMSGYIAGVLCAVISHPADTMVSKINNIKQASSTGDAVKQIYSQIGFKGLWSGLGTRIIMVGTLTGLQWWIYDTFKTAVGLQTTGGFKKN